MARLWFILLIIWYRALAITRTEAAEDKGSYNKATLFDANDPNAYSAHLEQNSLISRNKRSYDNQNEHEKMSKSIFETKSEDQESKPSSKTTQEPNQRISTDATTKPYEVINAYLEKCFERVDKRKFNAWGGKRSDQELEDCLDVLKNVLEPEMPFSYDNEYVDEFPERNYLRNKMSFHSWGGKRSAGEQSAPKRLPFRAWGGKRAPEEYGYLMLSRGVDPALLQNVVRMRNHPFLSEKRLTAKKTKFHSWGGKRSFDDDGATRQAQGGDDSFSSKGMMTGGGFRRRLKFNSWGGKRSDEDLGDELNEDKRTFHSWGGKRNNDESLMFYDDEESPDKRTFHSWGGK